MNKNNRNDKDRKSLNYLLGQSSTPSILKSDLRLPIIIKKQQSANTHQFQSLNSIVTNSKESKILKDDRWKSNKLYIDDYRMSSNRRLRTQSNHVGENIKKQKIKIFFTGLSNGDSSDCEDTVRRNSSNQEINGYIKKAQDLIKVIKKNKQKLIKLKINGPKITKEASYFNQKQSPERNKIYTYLQRNFTQKKEHNISDDILENYIATSSTDKLQSIEAKGRQFLLKKVQNDYKNYDKVDEYKKRYVRSLILEQIKAKKSQFQKEYKSRHHSPYFSYLSLSKDEKNRVIQRKQRKSLL